MKRYLLSWLLPLLVVAVANPVVASDYIQTNVRIETADRTVYSGDVYISSDGCTVRDTDGVKHQLTGTVAVCAFKAAAALGGFDYELQDSSYGLYLTSVDGEAANDTDYWSFFVNDISASVGISDYELSNGDAIILSLGGYPNSALAFTVPSKEVRVDDRLVVRVKADGVALSGATVHFNQQTVTTDGLGKASIRPEKATSLDIYVEADGYTRSATTTVRVEPKYTQNIKVTGAEQQTMMVSAADYLASQVEDGLLNDSQSVTDWAVISLANAGLDTSALNTAALEYDPTADDDYATGEISRHILVLSALGVAAYDDNGVDYVARLLETKDAGQFGDAAYVNDDIYAGLALLSAGAMNNDLDVQRAITAAKDSVNADGGVSYAVGLDTSDNDTTAVFVQLLSNVGDTSKVYRRAVRYLLAQQNLDGGWGYDDHGVSNSSSTATVLQALHAAGYRPNTVRRNHRSGYNFLASVQKPDGRFVYDSAVSYSYETLNSAYAITALAHAWLGMVD